MCAPTNPRPAARGAHGAPYVQAASLSRAASDADADADASTEAVAGQALYQWRGGCAPAVGCAVRTDECPPGRSRCAWRTLRSGGAGAEASTEAVAGQALYQWREGCAPAVGCAVRTDEYPSGRSRCAWRTLRSGGAGVEASTGAAAEQALYQWREGLCSCRRVRRAHRRMPVRPLAVRMAHPTVQAAAPARRLRPRRLPGRGFISGERVVLLP